MSKAYEPSSAPITLEGIREMCRLKGWTQRRLAEELRLSKNTVERWFCTAEKNRNYPSWAELIVMAQWLDEAREEQQAQAKAEERKLARQLQTASA